MNTTRRTRKRWAIGLATATLAAAVLVSVNGCTDLGEDVFGAVTAENFYKTEAEVVAAMAPVYAQLRSSLDAYHNISQVSSDETVVPTRGQDWFDQGVWLQLQYQTWEPSHPHLNDAWVAAFTGIARANVVLQTLSESDVAGKEAIIAELRGLRAYYYYQLMDLFGGVPIVGDDEFTVDPNNPPQRESRAAVFSFIESELNDVRESLPVQYEASGYGRITRGAVDVMLANMYLNAEVFSGSVSEGGLQRGPARWQDAVAAADRLLNSGVYELEANWFDNFDADNGGSREHIFVVAHLPEDGLGMNFPMRALHYNQFTPTPWNGFSTLAETFRSFDEDDSRRGIFLAGPQVNLDTGAPVNDRQGNPLEFTPEIDDIEQASEGEGVRILKFTPDAGRQSWHNGNDYAFFRLAEAYLIKAEALNELQGPNQTSIDLINILRDRVFDPNKPVSLGDFSSREALRDRILSERLFELTYEAKRRQDLIRHGRFNEAWEHKPASAPHRVVFPVPQTQRDANPNLSQNPGYPG